MRTGADRSIDSTAPPRPPPPCGWGVAYAGAAWRVRIDRPMNARRVACCVTAPAGFKCHARRHTHTHIEKSQWAARCPAAQSPAASTTDEWPPGDARRRWRSGISSKNSERASPLAPRRAYQKKEQVRKTNGCETKWRFSLIFFKRETVFASFRHGRRLARHRLIACAFRWHFPIEFKAIGTLDRCTRIDRQDPSHRSISTSQPAPRSSGVGCPSNHLLLSTTETEPTRRTMKAGWSGLVLQMLQEATQLESLKQGLLKEISSARQGDA